MNEFDQYLPGAQRRDTPLSDAPTAQGAPANEFDRFLPTAPPQQPTAPQKKPLNTPFGELRPAEYSWRDTIKNKAQDALMWLGAKPHAARHVGGGLVDTAALAPPIGAAIAGADTAYYSRRGDPLKAGVEALGTLPAARMGSRVVRGMPQKAIAPTEAELGSAADNAYNAWRSSGVRYAPAMIDDVTNEIARTLMQRGANRVEAPKQWQALRDVRSLKTQTGQTNQDFETLRKGLGGGETRSQIAAGEAAKETLENYLSNIPQQHIRSGTRAEIASDQQLLEMGRGNAAARFRSQTVTDPLNVAELKAQRGKDFGNVLENKIGALEETKAGQKSIRGFSDAEAEDVRSAITNRLTRGMDTAGSTLEALGGNRFGTPAGGIGAGLWYGAGLDPLTAGGLGVATQGAMWGAGRGLQNAAASRMGQGVENAAANIRMRSPLAQTSPSYGMVTDPSAAAGDAARYLAYPTLREDLQRAIDERRVPRITVTPDLKRYPQYAR